jgi:large subunit ribosomal protein L3
VKTQERDGYSAVQLGLDPMKKERGTKPQRGHAAKAKSTPHFFVREVRLDGDVDVEPGTELKAANVFEENTLVDVIGTAKGRGFAGVMKRWNFHGQAASHGVERKHRSAGAVGRAHSTAKGTARGKKMPGRMGACRRTVRGLRLVKVEPEKSLLLIGGAVPGPTGGYVIVRRSNVKR